MGTPILGMLAGQAAGALFGGIGAGVADARQLRQQEKLQALQIKGQKEMGQYNYEQQMKMWNETNYPAQVNQLKMAGLNPALMYGSAGAGGQTAAQPGSVSGGNAPSGGGEIMQGMMGLNLAMQKAQVENLQANTEKTKVDTAKTAGVDTDKATEEVNNLKLEGAIKSVLGEDMKSKWEEVTRPSRAMEKTSLQGDMTVRIALAQTIEEMWTEGKLKDMSVQQLESLLIQNAKGREEIKAITKSIDLMEANLKGKTLENAITEIELELQKTTGIDRNSPYWLKTLGRIFTMLMN